MFIGSYEEMWYDRCSNVYWNEIFCLFCSEYNQRTKSQDDRKEMNFENQDKTTQYNTTIQYNTIQYNAKQYNTIQYNTIQ